MDQTLHNMFQETEEKLCASGLVVPLTPVMGFLDATLEWNKTGPSTSILEEIAKGLSINSILFSKPAEPYQTIVSYLAETSRGVIYPEDCETRTFLHDLPISSSMNPEEIIPILPEWISAG